MTSCECDKLICDYCVELGGGPKKPDPVEQRIKEIARMEISPTPTIEFMEGVLRELVKMARAK